MEAIANFFSSTGFFQFTQGDNWKCLVMIFIACVLFFVLCWTIRYIRQKREEQIMAELIHHYTKDLKPGESRTLEFL